MRQQLHTLGLGLSEDDSIKRVTMKLRQSPQGNSVPRVEYQFPNTTLFCRKPNIIRRKRHQRSVLLMFDGYFGNANRTEEQIVRLI